MMPQMSRQEYTNLGMRLVSERPQVANELLAVKMPTPIQTDVSLISSYFLKYSNLKQLPQTRSDRYDFRILFVACMLHVYQPSAYLTKVDFLLIRRGVLYEIALAFNANPGNVSRLIRKAIMAHKIYSDFQGEVKTVLEGLK